LSGQQNCVVAAVKMAHSRLRPETGKELAAGWLTTVL